MPSHTSFDYAGWVLRAKLFAPALSQRFPGTVEGETQVAPPMSPAAVVELAQELGRPIPSSLRDFLEHGSAGIDFAYAWTPKSQAAEVIADIFDGKDHLTGGGGFCQAAEFAGLLADCKGWADDTWVAESPEDLAFWTQSFPILRLANGDYLALDQRSPSEDPAVVYLSHEDESKIIALSFTAFLAIWESLQYAGPESWLIEPFLDEAGLLSSEGEAAQTLAQACGQP